MQDNSQITVTMPEDIKGKLAELAGSESKISEYLTHLVLILHAKKCGRGGQVELEQTIIEIDELLKNESVYKQEIRSLEQHLERALAGQNRFFEAPLVNHRPMRRAKTALH